MTAGGIEPPVDHPTGLSSRSGLGIRPSSSGGAKHSFDIISTYYKIVTSHPEYTHGIAGVQALIELLLSHDSTTVFETLELLEKYRKILVDGIPKSAYLAAALDQFVQYTVSSLKRQEDEGPPADFATMRSRLLRNSSAFVSASIAARERIAGVGWRFVRDNTTVLTYGASRVVSTLLAKAARESKKNRNGSVLFRVVYVRDEHRPRENAKMVGDLRAQGIPVAEIPHSAVAYAFGLDLAVDVVMVGAAAVTCLGGCLARLGTYQIARLAKENKPTIPFYVAAEEHKFDRHYAAKQQDIDLGFEQEKYVLKFTADMDDQFCHFQDAIDFTPDKLITNLITENGVKDSGYPNVMLMNLYGSLSTDIK